MTSNPYSGAEHAKRDSVCITGPIWFKASVVSEWRAGIGIYRLSTHEDPYYVAEDLLDPTYHSIMWPDYVRARHEDEDRPDATDFHGAFRTPSKIMSLRLIDPAYIQDERQ